VLSATKDTQKAAADMETQRKRKQRYDKEQRKHDQTVNNLTESFNQWRRRPHPEPQAVLPVKTVNGTAVRQDLQARVALHRLHDHVKLLQNPVAQDELSGSKLEELACAFTDLLQPVTTMSLSPISLRTGVLCLTFYFDEEDFLF